jgi:hypothetical protein
MQPDNERRDARDDAATAAQARAHGARERAFVARQAAERATTEYARRAHNRSAELHDALALSHEDFVRALRPGGGPSRRLHVTAPVAEGARGAGRP